mgnify:FL=1
MYTIYFDQVLILKILQPFDSHGLATQNKKSPLELDCIMCSCYSKDNVLSCYSLIIPLLTIYCLV